MKIIFLIYILFTLHACGKPKTVMICGDHVCINKAEAEQYFEDNLSIEVKILKNVKNKRNSLVELNLNNSSTDKKIISVKNKKETKQEVKVLSNNEINKIKQEIKIKEKKKKLVKKIENTDKSNNNKNIKKTKKKNKSIKKEEKEKTTKNVEYNKNEIVDVCTLIKKCSIDEISNFLSKVAKKKKFPDITERE